MLESHSRVEFYNGKEELKLKKMTVKMFNFVYIIASNCKF